MSDHSAPVLRIATPADRDEIAELICVSTNDWYRAAGKPDVFSAGPKPCGLFWDVYEAIDPGRCVVAQDAGSGKLVGSCFYHPRPTHYSLGIMNAHPAHFGRGVAGRLLRFITDLADAEGKPTRLVSSAMNLDSFSLYTRAGFQPRCVYHDMILPPGRAAEALASVDASGIRAAVEADVPAIVELEWRISRIRRDDDWRHLIRNAAGIWHVSVRTDPAGRLAGVLASVDHPASHMLGPGVMTDDATAAALIAAELRQYPGRTPLFMVPADRPQLVAEAYRWGARNVEIHVAQVRGEFHPFDGVAIPTFMPETG